MRRLAVLLLVIALLALGAGCGGDDDDAASGDFCDRATLLDAWFSELEESFSGNEVPDSGVLEDAADAIADLADDAPEEIEEDLQTVADGVREVAEIFGEIDFTDPDALSDPANAENLQELGERMEALDEEVSGSSDRVEAYLSEECGIDISDDGSSDSESDDPSS